MWDRLRSGAIISVKRIFTRNKSSSSVLSMLDDYLRFYIVITAKIIVADLVLTNEGGSYVSTWSLLFARVISAIVLSSAIICEPGFKVMQISAAFDPSCCCFYF